MKFTVHTGMQDNNNHSPTMMAEAPLKIALDHVEPSALRFAIERSKELGNKAFKQSRYEEAIQFYTQAIAGDQKDRALFSNRSAAYLASGLFEQALWDAQAAVQLDTTWAKAYYRLGCACMSLNKWHEAVHALKKGIELDPSSSDMQARLADASKRVTEADKARRAAAATERHSLVLKLRAARREDQKLVMLNQFKQSMTAPDWELEDLEWRPTWMPSLRFSPIDVATAVHADPKRSALLGFVSALADLSYPKSALRTLSDVPRLQAYESALAEVLKKRQNGAHVLALSSGGGILPLLASRAGAGRVTAIERSRMLYRMAKQILSSNMDAPGTENVRLLARSLFAVGGPGEEEKEEEEDLPEEGAPGKSKNSEELTENVMHSRADILVTDLLDHTALGMGLLPALDHAARFLLTPGAQVLPARVRIRAVLVELSLPRINGFDLSPLDSYRWYPGDERVDLQRLPHKPLSATFLAHTLDLQGRVDAAQQQWKLLESVNDEKSESKNEGEKKKAAADWEADFELDIEIIADGKWNAVAFWFELDMYGSEKEDALHISSGGLTISPSPVSSSSGEELLPVGRSWGQALQYLDPRILRKGSTIQLRVRQDAGQIVFNSDPPPCRLRHALAPRWHYDMVQDQLRNEAYDAAVRAAVARKRDAGCSHLTALDIGAGTGLLSMMTVRAGADEAFAVEVSAHMCDVAEETTIMNGFLGKILVLDRDVRRMDTVMKPDGTAPELPRRADLAVFEIFDSGLIGEGVLHCLTAARARLLQMDAALVPARATVYAQPLEMRLTSAVGIDVSQANRWRWRPDYEGVELVHCRDAWTPLADPVEVFSFDFYEVERSMQPEEAVLDFKISKDGVVNAVAMWFDLHLDEENTLSTSPYAEKGPTWQQAVQWMPEVRVNEGEQMLITARHDTFSISYAFSSTQVVDERSTGVQLVDAAWLAAHDALQQVNSQLVKACVQNPLEYRAVAQAAVQFASRPHDLGLDAGQAAEFCMKLMG